MTNELIKAAQKARCLALLSIHAAASGHPGGVLSCIDILTVIFDHMRFEPTAPHFPERDRFVLSKGHAAPALYAVAALAGFIPVAELRGLRKLGHPLQGHPHVGTTPWVEASTGSLGQGFSSAIGMALGLRHQGNPAHVYTLLGDGEMQEGEVWEGLMCAANFRLSKLCAILDYNKMQSDDFNSNVMKIEPLKEKIQSFGWHTYEINGHDLQEIDECLNNAEKNILGPTFIIAHTTKGKGVSFMEGKPEWHGSVKLSDDNLVHALNDIGATQHEINGYINGSSWEN
jgi:transketolase